MVFIIEHYCSVMDKAYKLIMLIEDKLYVPQIRFLKISND